MKLVNQLMDHLPEPTSGPLEIIGLSVWTWLVLVVILIFAVTLLLNTFYVVRQQTAAIIERLGKLHAVKHPGLRVKIPFVDRIVFRMELQLFQMDIAVETKTKDNVFLKLILAVQYRVDRATDDRISDAYYKLDDEEEQITAFVSNLVRALLPGKDLDDAFADVNSISEQIQEKLAERMAQYGYIIEAVLVNDIKPDQKVVDAMNNINAAQRDRVAAEERGEAERILAVKRGEGVGGERKAIVAAYAESIELLSAAAGSDPAEASKLLALTMHYDAIREAANGQATTILLPTDGSTAVQQFVTGMVAANAAGKSEQ